MTSAIPATISALHTLWADAIPTVDVRSLVKLSNDIGTPADNVWRRVNIGHVPDTDGSLRFNRQWASAGNRFLSESFDVPCSLECISGDEDLTPLMDAAFVLLDDLSTALASDNTLGGLVKQGAAILDDGALTPQERESGGSIEIQFVVHCETRINQ